MSSNFSGLTPGQYDFLSQNYTKKGFISNPIRINNYSNPAINTSDRNWQETLKSDHNYNWSKSDQISWNKNCAFGPHNAGLQLDKMLFKK